MTIFSGLEFNIYKKKINIPNDSKNTRYLKKKKNVLEKKIVRGLGFNLSSGACVLQNLKNHCSHNILEDDGAILKYNIFFFLLIIKHLYEVENHVFYLFTLYANRYI